MIAGPTVPTIVTYDSLLTAAGRCGDENLLNEVGAYFPSVERAND